MELFTDGQPPFDFAELLSYRSQELEMTPVAEKIEDQAIRVIQFLFLFFLINFKQGIHFMFNFDITAGFPFEYDST